MSITLRDIRTAAATLRVGAAPAEYVCFVHPSVERTLRDVSARQRWRDAYREARIAGATTRHPREMLAAHKPYVMPTYVRVIEDIRFPHGSHAPAR